MGGVDESVGFNLTGTDARSSRSSTTSACPAPRADEDALRALVTARIAGARYDAGEVETRAGAQHRSARPGAVDRRRTCRSRWRSRSVTPRCRVPRRSTIGCNSTTSSARSAGRSRCRRRCGGSATCSSAVGWRKRTARWRRWRAALLARTLPRARVVRRAVPGDARAGRDDLVDASVVAARKRGADRCSRSGARTAGLTYAVQSLFVARERRELDGLVEVLDTLAAEHPHQPGFVTTAAWVRSRDRAARRSTRTSSSDSAPTASHSIPAQRCVAAEHAAAHRDRVRGRRRRPTRRALRAAAPVPRSLHRDVACAQLPRVGRALTRRCSRSRPATSTAAERSPRPRPRQPRRRSAHRCSRPGSTSRSPRSRDARGDTVGARALRTQVRELGERHGWTDVVHDAVPTR